MAMEYNTWKERGEPRSGTGSIFDWAGESIVHACNYLKKLFGEESCNIETEFHPYLTFCSMDFQPSLAGGTDHASAMVSTGD